MDWRCLWTGDAYGLEMPMDWRCLWTGDAYGLEMPMDWRCLWTGDAYGLEMPMDWRCLWPILGLKLKLIPTSWRAGNKFSILNFSISKEGSVTQTPPRGGPGTLQTPSEGPESSLRGTVSECELV